MGAVGRVYAGALFSVAKETGKVEEFKDQLYLMRYAVKNSTAFRDFLHHPGIKRQEKKRVISDVFSGILAPEMMNFFGLVIDDGRQNFLDDIYREYMEFYRRYKDYRIARVITAVELTSDEEKDLKATLEKVFGKEVVLKKEVDPSIIGGMVVRIGFQVIDDSIKSRLEELRTIIEG
ncbi:ATP synthase F1 subunit delta [Thermosediminibacter oceani]|uniref:ATP synthase subunit delta n=1 Tax=Thermosediminibacter oceani (strain ATCC BAA-1034 / DSM 16646 / JW/IW-1228P) TaxID=555079 RepID=D9RZW6_THEOJ|nr:ATP synthase F1 subunit delta [Thermosediminibacter oceani]ADL08743.1 ATP synthase F1, delta subunit [Thermosediminibacter oceani DSM 16646]